MVFNRWTHTADDDWVNDEPEEWEDCPDCGGEGSLEKWEGVNKWSLDPPCGIVVPCETCHGTGGGIVPKSTVRPLGECDLDERCGEVCDYVPF